MANHTQNNDHMALKLNILKKGILEERQKNAELLKENSYLKEDLQTQNEIVNKLQEEIVQLREKTGQKQIKKFFNTFFEGEEEDEEQHNKMKEDLINSLKREIDELKEQIISMQKEKHFINTKLNEQIKQYEDLKQESKNQIEKVHQHYQEKEQNNVDDSTRINLMSEIIKKLQKEKIEHEKTIEIYENNKQNRKIEVEILFKEQNQLIDEIEELKKEIHDLKEENSYLHTKIEELTPITKKTIFKGIRLLTKKPRKTLEIELTFGKIENALVITEAENQKGTVIDMKYILLMDKAEENKLEIKTKTCNHEEQYLIEINSKYIDYILEFYKELSQNNKKGEDDTLNNYLIHYFTGDGFV